MVYYLVFTAGTIFGACCMALIIGGLKMKKIRYNSWIEYATTNARTQGSGVSVCWQAVP